MSKRNGLPFGVRHSGYPKKPYRAYLRIYGIVEDLGYFPTVESAELFVKQVMAAYHDRLSRPKGCIDKRKNRNRWRLRFKEQEIGSFLSHYAARKELERLIKEESP